MIPQTNSFLHRSEFTLGILAGGRGMRAGNRDKGLLVFAGQTLIDRVVSQTGSCFSETLVCCRSNHWFYSIFAQRVFSDSRPGEGPLWGIANLLGATETEFLAILPCDQKTLAPGWLGLLVDALDEEHMGVFVSDEGQHTPCCLLRLSARPIVEEALDNKQRSMRALLENPLFTTLDIASMGDDVDDIGHLSKGDVDLD